MLALTASEKHLLLGLARETLVLYFQRNAPDPVTAFKALTASVTAPHPCFVSLYGVGKRLRGCIGCTQTAEPLYKTVSQYAELAAFSDPRFPPVKHQEIEALRIQISVLGPLTPLRSWDDITVGKHGLWVEHEHSRGLLLAQVGIQHGFSLDQFRDQTCLKAGLEPHLLAHYQWKFFEEVSFEEE